jgi:hypothetical protein
MTKLTITTKFTCIADHFEGLADVLEQYRRHLPMQYVQGNLRSYWTPPSGSYLLRIAPAAARATANKTTTKNGSTLLAILMATAVHRYKTVHIA